MRGRRRFNALRRNWIFDDAHWLYPLAPDELCVYLSIISFSSVFMTRTVTGLSSREIIGVVFVARGIQRNAEKHSILPASFLLRVR